MNQELHESPVNSMNLKGYPCESCYLEFLAGGILLYNGNQLSYKPTNE